MERIKNNQSRLGIFVFYDVNTVVNDYVIFLLNSITEVVNELIIVVNKGNGLGTLKELSNFTSYLYVRENTGYDGGAYKDVFLKFHTDENWERWDEIVLFNDTFYGPFFSWKYIFDKFSKEKVDFWGLSKWVKGDSRDLGCEIDEHVQGYFIVIRKSLILSSHFFEFWNNLQYPYTYRDAVIDFEANFSGFFTKKGYQYKTWLDLMDGNSLLHEGEVVYLKYANQLICDLHFPIVKRKVFSITNFIKIDKIIKYIEKNYCYDINLIWDHLKYLDKNQPFKPFSINKMEDFYNSHKKIYIYGYGKWGHEIEKYFEYKKWKVEKFVVSEKTDRENIISFSELMLDKMDGLILALGYKAFEEVYPMVVSRYNNQQLLIPNF